MKIGIVTEWFDRGSAFVSREFIKQLENQGHEVAIYARNEAGELGQEIWSGTNVYLGQIAKIKKAKAIDRRDFEAWIQRNHLTHLIFNEQIWIPPLIWAKLKGLITIGYVDYYTRKSIHSFRLYDALICNTKRHFSVFSWHPNAWYIPWGTDINVFSPWRVEKGKNLVFLHSAGWSPYRKGTDLLIRAFLLLPYANIKLRIHSQLASLDWLEKFGLAEAVKNDPRIEIIETAMHANDFMRSGDVYVYPSRLEGIGLTQIEALASGLPIVVSNEEPMSEFAQDGYSRKVQISHRWRRDDGYYWDMCEVDVGALRENMEWFCIRRHDQVLWQVSAREYALENLDSNKNFANFATQVCGTTTLNWPKYGKLFTSLRYGATNLQVDYLSPTILFVRGNLGKIKRLIQGAQGARAN